MENTIFNLVKIGYCLKLDDDIITNYNNGILWNSQYKISESQIKARIRKRWNTTLKVVIKGNWIIM